MAHHGARRGSGKASRAWSPPVQRVAPRTRSRRAEVLTTKSRERVAACQSRARCCGKRDAEPWRIDDIGRMRRYALKHEAYAMKPATGAITWTRSQKRRAWRSRPEHLGHASHRPEPVPD